jgi:hypothetical protein
MIKVEKQERPNGVTLFAFECNSKEDHDTLDKLRVAILGKHVTDGGIVNSNRFVIEARVPEKTLPELSK